MKQRLLVMNGSCIIQNEQAGQWQNTSVEKAGAVKPGIYNIYLASQADKSKSHDGPIIHIDKDKVYQQQGKSFVSHEKASFDKVPEIGRAVSISYDSQGKAQVGEQSQTLTRGMSR